MAGGLERTRRVGSLKGCERAALPGRAPPEERAPSRSADCTGVRCVLRRALGSRAGGAPHGGTRAVRSQSRTRKGIRAGPSRCDPRASIPIGPPRPGAHILARSRCAGHAPRGSPPSGSCSEERTGGIAACSRFQPGAACSRLRPGAACSGLRRSAVPPAYAVSGAYASTSAAESDTQSTRGAGGRLGPRATHDQDGRALLSNACTERQVAVARRCAVPPLRAPSARRNPGAD
jgi:hypothetical protein